MTSFLRGVFVNTVVASSALPRIRVPLLRFAGFKIGQRVSIAPRCHFDGNQVDLGSDVFVNFDVFIDSSAPVVICSGTSISPGVMILTSSHDVGSSGQRAGTNTIAPVTIGHGCWVGARAVILPGVTIGDGCVIAAGSVVIEDCKPDSLYAGVPAVFKREFEVS